MNKNKSRLRTPAYRLLGQVFYGGFFIFLFLLPIFRGVIYPTEKAIFFLFLVTLWLIWQGRKLFTPTQITLQKPFYQNKFFWASFLICLAIWWQSLAVSAKPLDSLPELLQMTALFLIFNLGQEAFAHRRRKKQLFIFFYLNTIFHIVISFGLYFNLLKHDWWETAEFLSGTFVNHNHFAGFICLLFFLIFGCCLGKRSDNQSPFLILLILTGTLLLLSMSRGGWLASCIVLFTGGLMLFRNKALYQLGLRIIASVIFSIILFLIVIYGQFNPELSTRFHSFFQSEKQAEFTDFRIRLWQSSLAAIREKPLFGYGKGSFSWEMRPFRQERFPYQFDYAHNDYLQFMMECGLLIFIPSLFFLVLCLISFYRKFHSPKLYYFRFEELGLFLAVLCLLIHGIVDFNLHIFSNLILWGLYLGLITEKPAIK